MYKILVSYFSATGATKRLAERIASSMQADLFEIEPEVKYTANDLKWPSTDNRSCSEMKMKRYRPLVSKKIKNINDYDVIFLGFPVWYDMAPKIINTFLEENNLTGKIVYIFVTSGAHTVDRSFRELKKSYPEIKFISGKRFNGRFSEKELLDWVS